MGDASVVWNEWVKNDVVEMFTDDSKGMIGKMNYATEEEDDGKCGESEETLRVEDFESVNRCEKR